MDDVTRCLSKRCTVKEYCTRYDPENYEYRNGIDFLRTSSAPFGCIEFIPTEVVPVDKAADVG